MVGCVGHGLVANIVGIEMVFRPEVWQQSAGVIRIAQNRLEIDHGIKRATAPYEVQAELASKIQARARERGVSIDVYLLELIDRKGTESESSSGLSSQERVRMLREWASGHSTNRPVLSDDAISRESIYGERGQRPSMIKIASIDR